MAQRILVVDDDVKIVRLLRASLKQAGYQVLVAHNGETALRMLHRERPDLVVLDLMLPDRDGWDVTRVIRDDKTLADTPIIMLTARVEHHERITGLELGADDYVTKPFHPGELLARIRAVLRRVQGTAAAARAVAAGDLAQQVETGGSIEIAQVGQAFNEMTTALQEAEVLRKNMVADVAHELRTPLSVLQGNLWAVLNDTYPLEKIEIARLYDETRLLSRLVEDLHDLALADAGQLQLDVQPTDVGQLIRHTVDNFALAAEAKEVTLTAQLPDEARLIHVDPDRVAQVLRNLLVNALRHTPPGGAVTVEAVAQNGMVEITVADTGEDIAPEHIAHVFERFWRADPARSRSENDGKARLGSGTGLGLAVAQSLVEAQGGRIWVESTLGEGTTFRFTLPLERRY
jgi:two-component system OmpR family sensor kinase/two-component system sensor histidine kinase BaeS